MSINYQELIDESMLEIVRKILQHTQDNGLVDDHCFYISFDTHYPEVILSPQVKKRYPKEITIVLQYQFKDLHVMKDRFAINIAFNGVHETIEVPLAALTSFVDPSVNFSLQFHTGRGVCAEKIDLINEQTQTDEIEVEYFEKKKPTTLTKTNQKLGQVIAIDKFRKK